MELNECEMPVGLYQEIRILLCRLQTKMKGHVCHAFCECLRDSARAKSDDVRENERCAGAKLYR